MYFVYKNNRCENVPKKNKTQIDQCWGVGGGCILSKL